MNSTSGESKNSVEPVKNPDAIVPQNMDQVRLLLTGRDPRFREPLTRSERRAYDKVWRRRGKGYTKSMNAKPKKSGFSQKRQKPNSQAEKKARRKKMLTEKRQAREPAE